MCVLIIKNKGVKMPSEAILDACAIANPHGFGFVSESDYFKSLSYDRFKARLSAVGDDEACMIHFRLATHGSIRRANCHPFKLGDLYFAHNGVLPITPDRDRTDSETAFRRYLAKPALVYGLHSEQLSKAVEGLIGASKFAFMQGADIVTFGKFVCLDGMLYSNTRWQYYMR